MALKIKPYHEKWISHLLVTNNSRQAVVKGVKYTIGTEWQCDNINHKGYLETKLDFAFTKSTTDYCNRMKMYSQL